MLTITFYSELIVCVEHFVTRRAMRISGSNDVKDLMMSHKYKSIIWYTASLLNGVITLFNGFY